MDLKDVIYALVMVIFAIISFVYKGDTNRLEREIDQSDLDIKEIKNELEQKIKEREERSFQSNKECWIELNKNKERITKIETVQELCRVCKGEKDD